MNDQNTNEFYFNLFVQNQNWNKPYLNYDESVRSGKILEIISEVIKEYHSTVSDRLRIIDVGCGRGWLTSLLNGFGTIIGIEPVEEVVEFAKSLFPNVNFYAATPKQYIQSPDFSPFDILICSEVIEHVSYDEKSQFIQDLVSLLKPKGYLVFTTPRGELFSQWKTRNSRTQPIENWLTEKEMDSLLESCNLKVIKRYRCFSTKLYIHPFRIFHKRPFRKLMSYLGYSVDESDGMIYQVVLARKF